MSYDASNPFQVNFTALMNKRNEGDEVAERDHDDWAIALGEKIEGITPSAFGYVTMKMLSHDAIAGNLTLADKIFWLEVSETLGPDWIAALRNVCDFMDKASDF